MSRRRVSKWLLRYIVLSLQTQQVTRVWRTVEVQVLVCTRTVHDCRFIWALVGFEEELSQQVVKSGQNKSRAVLVGGVPSPKNRSGGWDNRRSAVGSWKF